MTILKFFESADLKNAHTFPALIKIVNDEIIFKYRDANEVGKMLQNIEYCGNELQSEFSLLVFSNQRLLKSTTFDKQMEILNLANKFKDEKAGYIAKAACLLDLGSYADNMNILLEMAGEHDIDKVKAMYDYIEQLYGKDEQEDITYNKIINQINVISPTLELFFQDFDDMERLYSILKASNIEHFDTNPEIYAKNDRGRVQKVKLM